MPYRHQRHGRATRSIVLACALLLSCCTGTQSNVEVSSTTPSVQASGKAAPAHVSDSEGKHVHATGAQPAAVIRPVSTATPVSSSRSIRQDARARAEAYTGFYEVLGERPKSIAPFGNFVIRSAQGTSISGAVIPDEGRVFEFSTATLDAGKLLFSTKEVDGISYSFDGSFTAAPPFASDSKTVVAKGLLTKLQKGKSVVEADLKFYYDEGGGE